MNYSEQWRKRFCGLDVLVAARRCVCFVCAFAVLLTVCLFSVQDAGAAGRPVTTFEYEIFTDAKEHLDKNRLPEAAKLLGRYFRGHSQKHLYGYELYGVVLLQMDRSDLAVKVLQEGFAAYPQSVALAQNLGTALYRQDNPLEAAKAYMAAYALSDNTQAPLAYTAAVFYARAEQYGKAAAILRPLMTHENAKPDWHILLGQCLLRDKKEAEAAAVLRNAIRVYPEEAKVWRMLGFVYYRQGLREKAAATYEIAYKLAPPNKRESAQLASLYCSLGAPSLGARLIGDAPPTPEMLDNLAVTLARGGDLQASLEQVDKALEQAPTDARKFFKGQVLMRMERTDEARVMFTSLAAKGGKLSAKAQWVLAIMAWNKGDWSLARAELKKLVGSEGKFKTRASRLLKVLDEIEAGTREAPHPA